MSWSLAIFDQFSSYSQGFSGRQLQYLSTRLLNLSKILMRFLLYYSSYLTLLVPTTMRAALSLKLAKARVDLHFLRRGQGVANLQYYSLSWLRALVRLAGGAGWMSLSRIQAKMEEVSRSTLRARQMGLLSAYWRGEMNLFGLGLFRLRKKVVLVLLGLRRSCNFVRFYCIYPLRIIKVIEYKGFNSSEGAPASVQLDCQSLVTSR